MKTSSKRKKAAVIATLGALAVISGTHLHQSKQQPQSPEPRGSVDNQNPSPGSLTVRAEHTDAKPTPDLRKRPEAILPTPIMDGGQPKTFVIALDEAMLRMEDGSSKALKISPPATRETLRARLNELSRNGVALPVLYPAGQERNIYTRRVVTPDLRVKTPVSSTDRVADTNALAIKELPDFAPGWAILSASDAMTALEAIPQLRATNGVAEADVLLAAVHPSRLMPNDPLVGQQWHLKRSGTAASGTDVNIEHAWAYGTNAGVRGNGIRISIVDDGVQMDHPDLIQNLDPASSWNFVANNADPSPGLFDFHGTACAGNAGARGNNGLGGLGTAPESTLVALRLLNDMGFTDLQSAQALAWQNETIDISSNSWGPPDTGLLLSGHGPLAQAALQNSASNGRGGKGTIFMWAGGNGGAYGDNSNADSYANSIYTIAVGATDSRGQPSYFTERGANILVCGPSGGDGSAVGITTTDITGPDGYSTGDYTHSFSGTSSSTPTVAGIVALMLEKNPDLGWRDVQEILIRSATKLRPADLEWAQNGAGLRFHHRMGAGLVNATAAVNLASNWTNLGPVVSRVVTRNGLNQQIGPSADAVAIATFDLSDSSIRTEHVRLKVNIQHSARRNLDIYLTSPTGMVSRMAEMNNITYYFPTGSPLNFPADYPNWTFMSVRHWGEEAEGVWTLSVRDRSTLGNTDGGTLLSAELEVLGTDSTPTNPPPTVAFAAPSNGQAFSPGSTVDIAVTANDLDISGNPGDVVEVRLYENGQLLTTLNQPPYVHSYTPSNGTLTLSAEATDNEGLIGTAAPVIISVANQAPVMTRAELSSNSQIFSDQGTVQVIQTTAVDAENDPITFSYQWQSSADGVNFTDAPLSDTDTLVLAPDMIGQLWRCAVRASDGSQLSQPLFTSPVNVLERPESSAQIEAAYAYQSGLVLRGIESPIIRRAIINEFSQGPVGSAAEWVEILTLQETNLTNWTLRDSANNTLMFRNSPVWQNIPAGTLIVIYNGNSTKDPRLPADTTDASSGKMVLNSRNTAYFDPSYSFWIPLENVGDTISLVSDELMLIHALSYGNSYDSATHIGTVGNAMAAAYHGGNDEDADLAERWNIVSATTSGLPGKNIPAGLLPGITLTGGSYSQNFNITPGFTGSTYPAGWTCYNGSQEDPYMVPTNLFPPHYYDAGHNFNYGSRIGILGAPGDIPDFKTGSIVLALENTIGMHEMAISYDVIKIRESTGSVLFKLQYSTTSPTSGFVDVPGGAYVSGAIPQDTVTQFINLPLPAALENRPDRAFLRWHYALTSSQLHPDGLALDNVVISTPQAPHIALSMSLSSSSIMENAGTDAAMGTIRITKAQAFDLKVELTSSDTRKVTLPANVIIPAGQTSTTFSINAVDNLLADGTQYVGLRATNPGYNDATATIMVLDNEPPIAGVTPGHPNNSANTVFVQSLRNGTFNGPSLFRLGAGTNLPIGLTLNPETGLLSGTVSAQNTPGNYSIIIERHNVAGEVVSQSFTITVTEAIPQMTYAAWSQSRTTLRDLPDNTNTGGADGNLPDLVKYALGMDPGSDDFPAPLHTEIDDTSISIIYERSKLHQDVELEPEWSSQLGENAIWSNENITRKVLEDRVDSRLMKATLPIVPGEQRFLRLRAHHK